MAASPSPTQDEIRRFLTSVDRSGGCFLALGDAGLDSFRGLCADSGQALRAAFANAAVVVDLRGMDDLRTALETIRQAHEWLAGAREARMAQLLEQALVDKAMTLKHEDEDTDWGHGRRCNATW